MIAKTVDLWPLSDLCFELQKASDNKVLDSSKQRPWRSFFHGEKLNATFQSCFIIIPESLVS